MIEKKDNKPEIILSIQNVCKSFPSVKALDNVCIDIVKGTVHGIIGENGAGKSTLMKILSGVYTKDFGTIIFDDEKIEKTTPLEALRRGLSIIYQEFNLVNSMSVGENIYLGRFGEMKGMRNTHKNARQLLNSIGSTIDTYASVGSLSTSEMQMVEIAKALSFDSKVIIMDEPSSTLTTEEMERLGNIIFDLRKRGITIIYISHKLDEIFKFCDNVTIMRDGCVINSGPTSELTRSDMIAQMVGRTIENEYPERPNCAGDTIMEVHNINTHKLNDVSFELKRGEILGLVGLVGAGRTEIVRAIVGADKARGHRIVINGKETAIRNPKQAKDAAIGFLPEDRKTQGLVLKFSVEANIVMAKLEKLKKGFILDKNAKREVADRQIESLRIKTPSRKATTSTLSGGNQQKCILGRWLEIEPDILILDEPTRGIDVGAKFEIYLLMKQVVERGGSIIMISSELPEVLNMSNRILTISGGRITGEFDPAVTPADIIMGNALD